MGTGVIFQVRGSAAARYASWSAGTTSPGPTSTLWIVKFRTTVEPAERMRGLEIPETIVDALGGGKRPPVIITVNGHTWKSRVAIMRGRYLLGLSNANRRAARLTTGDEVEVDVQLDAKPRVVVEPEDFARALDADPAARGRVRPPGLHAQARARSGHRGREEDGDPRTPDREGGRDAAGRLRMISGRRP